MKIPRPECFLGIFFWGLFLVNEKNTLGRYIGWHSGWTTGPNSIDRKWPEPIFSTSLTKWQQACLNWHLQKKLQTWKTVILPITQPQPQPQPSHASGWAFWDNKAFNNSWLFALGRLQAATTKAGRPKVSGSHKSGDLAAAADAKG